MTPVMIRKVCFNIIIVTSLSACHQPLTNPEKSEPIYNDIKKQRDKVDAELTQTEKDLEKAKTALDQAPIRTGQRQDALDDYFAIKHTQQQQIELYRYLSLKLQQRKAQDSLEYQASLTEKKPWPNPQDYQNYILEQKLATAPREWSPENREKERKPASEPKKENTSEEGGE